MNMFKQLILEIKDKADMLFEANSQASELQKECAMFLNGDENSSLERLIKELSKSPQKELVQKYEKQLVKLLKSYASNNIVRTKTTELSVHPLVKNLFGIDKALQSTIRKDIEKNGFNEAHPLEAVKSVEGKFLIFAGQTRLAAAREINRDMEVPVIIHEELDDIEIKKRAVKEQFHRRNSSDPVVLEAVELLLPNARKQAEKEKGKRKDLSPTSGTSGKRSRGAAGYIAEALGLGHSKIEEAIKVIESKYKEEIKAGKITIHKAYEALIKEEKNSDLGNSFAVKENNIPKHPPIKDFNDNPREETEGFKGATNASEQEKFKILTKSESKQESKVVYLEAVCISEDQLYEIIKYAISKGANIINIDQQRFFKDLPPGLQEMVSKVFSKL